MPTLIPAPKLNRNNSNEGSNEIKPLPKIVKKEKFWEYEEIDEKPKEKRKRKLVSIDSARWYIFNTNRTSKKNMLHSSLTNLKCFKYVPKSPHV